MSLRHLVALFTLLLVAPIERATAGEPRPFGRGSWQELRHAHAGQPTVVHFWALSCGPCLVELPVWGALVRERPDLRLVFVNIDRVLEKPERMIATLDKVGLGAVENWVFADRFAERLRFEVDPNWRGELPRTLLITRDGAVTAFSGAADPAAIRRWIDGQVRASSR
jgi:thiol-disulfide isomerase/thioredoxin